MIAIFLHLRFPKWWCKWDMRTKPKDQWKPSNFYLTKQGPLSSWSYGMSWIYISVYYHLSFVFKACSWRGVLDTTVCDKVCQWLAARRWFSPGIFIHQKILPPRYNWNIVENGLKNHNPNPNPNWLCMCSIEMLEINLSALCFWGFFLWTLELYIGKWGQSVHILVSFSILILIRMVVVGSGLHHTRNQIYFCCLGLTCNTQSVLLYNYHI
jgi:hypothetical protein